MRAHSDRAMGIATRLHDLNLPVVYPGLSSHPDYELMTRQLNEGYGYGGLLTLDLNTLDRANAFMEHLQNRHGFGFMAVSLGYSDTLMSASGASTSSELTEDALVDAGIGPGLVRLSMGYTGTLEQRWTQLRETLEHVGMIP
jgi:methionine-gamma-lyase